jgi:hypothetical protein
LFLEALLPQNGRYHLCYTRKPSFNYPTDALDMVK